MAKPWHKTLKEEEEFDVWQELQTEDGLTYYFNTETQETQWEKPEALMSAHEQEQAGNWVWAPDEEQCYVPAIVVGVDEDEKEQILELETGEQISVPASQKLISLQQSSLQRIVADLTLLDEMSVPLILHCLRKRFEAGKIYSSVGTILISINPYKMLPLYGRKVILKYRNAFESHKDPPPHVYCTADQAYRGLTMPGGMPQAIIISGESGAGKTEAAKQVLGYLGAVAGSVSGVEKKVFDANPILESFGNAKTLRNNNSSRFGKYVEIYFNEHNQLCGGRTTNYLLEKIRCVQQSNGERNFHIFYMLCKAPKAVKKKLKITSAESYKMLVDGDTTQVPGINDKSWFEEVSEAFSSLEFSKSQQDSALAIVAGLMHMGNITFQRVKGQNTDDTCKVKKKGTAIKDAAGLLKVSATTLEKACIISKIMIKGQAPIEKGLKPAEAQDQRDAMIKYIYSKLFDWLVIKINKCMVPKGHASKTIGILDIFGFEIFKVNSLEQLMINFTNEKLQQLFNFAVFKEEERIYRSEKIGFGNIDYTDNQMILDLIEASKPRMGILHLLNEEIKTPGGSEEKYRAKLKSTHGSHSNFGKPRGRHFVLTHYAGAVKYDTDGWMEKNKDTLAIDLLDLISSSKMKLLSGFVPKNMKSSKRKATLATQFMKQLNDLMGALRKTQTHYIRCIKPNDEKAELYFVPRNCLEQMTYSGVFEAVKIRKSGFPFRLKHKDFVARYKCLLEESRKKCGKGLKGCKDIIKFLKIKKDDIREGKSMLLYRAKQHKIMELKRSIIVEKRRMNDLLQELIDTDPDSLEEPEMHFERLARAIRSCKRYRIDNELSRAATQLLEQYIEDRMDPETKRKLHEAVETRDIDLLREVCEIVEAEEYQTKLATQAIRLRDRIDLIISEAENGAATLEAEPMKAVCKATDEIDYWSEEQYNTYCESKEDDEDAYFDPHIERIRYVMSLGENSMKFIQEQMKAAVANKNMRRQIKLSMKLKNKVFEQGGEIFKLSNSPMLKGPKDWAGEKLLPFGKGALAEGMMKWTVKDIHTSLTEIPDKPLRKRACNEVFVGIRQFTGDKPLKGGDQFEWGSKTLGHAVGELGTLGDELYFQLIKQTTECGNPIALKKYWELLNVCLYTYPPSKAFENYLEYWLRNQRKDDFIIALHTILYNKRVPRAPSTQDVKDIVNGLRKLNTAFLDEEPPSAPAWAALSRPYMADDDDYVEDRELAGAVMAAPKMANTARTSNKRKRKMSIKNRQNRPSIKPASGGPPVFPGKGGGPGKKKKKKTGGKKKKTKPKFTPPVNPMGGGPPPNPMGGGGGDSEEEEENKAPQKAPPKKAPGGMPPPAPAAAAPPTFNPGAVAAKAGKKKKVKSKGKAKAKKKKMPKQPPKEPTPEPEPEEEQKGGEHTWVVHLDPNGEEYYENCASGETQWEKPDSGTIKELWVYHYDEASTDWYYECVNDGATLWDMPNEFQDPNCEWTVTYDAETNSVSYMNNESGQSSAVAPPDWNGPLPETGEEWARHFDPDSNDFYYENLRTGDTQWVAPPGVTSFADD